nr:uncharacterized protein LOC124813698 [Hydra vulgaris]
MDIRVGAILGHNNLSRELYAIHRNQKLYLMFHNLYKKWLAVTNREFEVKISSSLNWTQLKTVEKIFDKAVTFGPNQWMVNGAGLYFRKLSDSNWIQRIKWNV